MDITFLLLIAIIAFFYASVGHGGASGYLALMALFSIDPSLMRSSALVLNLFVSSIAFIAFYKGGHFRWKLLLPFIIASIPMAFIGAKIEATPVIYKTILGFCLLLAIGRMLIRFNDGGINSRPLPFTAGLLIGAMLGFISGLIGIGGGIILSPILILFRWANMKETAAAAAMFILLNSASGLISLGLNGVNFGYETLIMIVMAITGGLAGSYSGSFRLQHKSLKYILASVLLVASLKLFFT